MEEKVMHTDFLSEINDIVEDASKHIVKRVIIKDLSKQLCDEVKNYTPILCGEVANSSFFGDSFEDFDSSLSKEALTRIFQLHWLKKWWWTSCTGTFHTSRVLSTVNSYVKNTAHAEEASNCEDCQISWEEVEEKWNETKMGHWDGQSSYLPYLQANIKDIKSEASVHKCTYFELSCWSLNVFKYEIKNALFIAYSFWLAKVYKITIFSQSPLLTIYFTSREILLNTA
jgi:hypothetical protein